MQCPKCTHDMEDVEIHDVLIKRCTLCKGLWFDRTKHEYLRKEQDSSCIDTGDPQIGKAFDKIEDYLCPECHSPMIKMVVADQPHIHFESCSHCFSAFFDAGEFTDYVEKDLIDFFKGLMSRER
ncbi:MAG: zf-TFIIB domain-containing protein [Gammaproteobacteria bacterium]